LAFNELLRNAEIFVLKVVRGGPSHGRVGIAGPKKIGVGTT
jgi:hypothetical protein